MTEINTAPSPRAYLTAFELCAMQAAESLPQDISDQAWLELQPVCAICFEKVEQPDYSKHCQNSHVFHINCINAWLNRSNTCPCCRCQWVEVQRPSEDDFVFFIDAISVEHS